MKPNPLLRLVLTSISLGACAQVTESEGICIDVSDELATCPDAADVDISEAYVSGQCGDDIEATSVSGKGVLSTSGFDGQQPTCCYSGEYIDWDPNSACAVGRPYTDESRPVNGQAQPGAEWTKQGSTPLATSAGRKQAWINAGLVEHASIAAFSKLSLDLMAHGAPAALLREVHLAGLDEIDHAERCFSLGGRVQPGAFPFPGFLNPNRKLADVASDAVREGCVGETLGAVLARAAAGLTEDKEVRQALSAIAADEERHAALSWRIVSWALRVGGADVRSAVERAFSERPAQPEVAELALRAGVSEALLWEAAKKGVNEVIRPAAQVLLAA